MSLRKKNSRYEIISIWNYKMTGWKIEGKYLWKKNEFLTEILSISYPKMKKWKKSFLKHSLGGMLLKEIEIYFWNGWTKFSWNILLHQNMHFSIKKSLFEKFHPRIWFLISYSGKRSGQVVFLKCFAHCFAPSISRCSNKSFIVSSWV